MSKSNLSKLNQTRLDVINGNDKSSAVIDLINTNISRVIQKILKSDVYKNGKLTNEFINLNPNMLDIRVNKNISVNPFKPITVNDIESYIKKEGMLKQPIGMYELYIYKFINLYSVKVFPNNISHHILSSKHFIGEPPVWEGENIISKLKESENNYREIKGIYKLVGFLTTVRMCKK